MTITKGNGENNVNHKDKLMSNLAFAASKDHKQGKTEIVNCKYRPSTFFSLPNTCKHLHLPASFQQHE